MRAFRIVFLPFFMLGALFGSTDCFAQKCSVFLYVCDGLSGDTMDNIDFALVKNDSIKVPVDVAYYNHTDATGGYYFEFDYAKGRYNLSISHPGYEPDGVEFKVASKRRLHFGDFGVVYLQKSMMKTLNEVSVTSTHIKMVMKGDTIVYDAAAFQLSKGSMLDALVAQLPGTKLEGDVITVNGKPIASLLINGEDFFGGNASVALRNLPSYTVKDIKVYDREADDAYLRSEGYRKTMMGTSYVMDVNLKKIYRKGLMGNIDAAYGMPDNKYLGKVFLMGTYGDTRLAAYFNANNINDTQGAGTGGWYDGWGQDGRMTIQNGGLDFLHKAGRMKYTANVTATHELPSTEEAVSSVNFYSDGDVYSRSHTATEQRKSHVIAKGTAQYSGKNVYVTVSPYVDHMRAPYGNFMRRADFTESPSESYRMESLDSLFRNMRTSGYYAHLLNMMSREEDGCRQWVIGRLNASSTVKFPWFGDNLDVSISGEYNRSVNDGSILNNRIYGPESGLDGQTEQIFQDKDVHKTSYNVNAAASYLLNSQLSEEWFLSFKPSLGFSRSYASNRQTIDLAEIEASLNDGGALLPPSAFTPEMLRRDLENSEHSRYGRNVYTAKAHLALAYADDGKRYTLGITAGDAMHQERLVYNNLLSEDIVTRFNHSPGSQVRFAYELQNNPRVSVETELTYNFSQQQTDIFARLNRVNNSDPNNVYLGNPDLLRPLNNRVEYSIRRYDKRRNHSLFVGAYFDCTNRAVATARFYDRETGVNTWRPMNINGNWAANVRAMYMFPFASRRFRFTADASLKYNHSVDFSSDTDSPVRSVVNSVDYRLTGKLRYSIGQHTIGYQGQIDYTHGSGGLGLSGNFDVFDYTNELNATFSFAYDWEIDTDMTVYCRRGYQDNAMNNTDWVWNAGVSKTLLKGNLTLKLEAKDILGQVSDVQYSINAQGRTERWTYRQSRYAMLHVIWKFNALPK